MDKLAKIIAEMHLGEPQVDNGSPSISNPDMVDAINDDFAASCIGDFATPYLSFNNARRILVMNGLNTVDTQEQFVGLEGEFISPIAQWQDPQSEDSGFLLYFSYQMNGFGGYYCFAGLATNAEIESLYMDDSMNNITEVRYLSHYAKASHKLSGSDKKDVPEKYENLGTTKSGHTIAKYKTKFNDHYAAINPTTKKIDMHVDGEFHDHKKAGTKTFHVGVLSGAEGSTIKAHDFYHHILTHDKGVIFSSDAQSKGGMRVWQRLKNKYKSDVHVHEYDPNSNVGKETPRIGLGTTHKKTDKNPDYDKHETTLVAFKQKQK